ncbi:MAG: hypothetical protein KGL53_16330, partial [Elusimicrobia bacterium]|nr:hypothetical protein [Elusimicrobiota bacterium]
MKSKMNAKSLLSRLAAFDRDRGLLESSDRVLVGLSGGADSVCLSHWLARRVAKGTLRAVGLVHFHHGLRGRAADADAVLSGRLAARLGVPLVVEALPVRAAARR